MFGGAFEQNGFDSSSHEMFLAKVFETRFWMLLLGGLTSKPTVVYSNGSWISGLYTGPLTKEYKEKHTQLQTTR